MTSVRQRPKSRCGPAGRPPTVGPMADRLDHPLGVAVIGPGFMGRLHARAARLHGARLIGVAGSTASRAQAAGRELGTAGFADPVALATHDDVDVVHICTPNDTHVPLATAALAAGKHVICEKPLATGAAEATALAEQARAAGLVGAVPFVYRFYPMVREARERIAAGALGRPHLIHGGYLQDWLLGSEDTNWRVDEARGGRSRAFADIGCHWCDLVEFVSGDRIAALAAQVHVAIPERRGVAVTTEDIALISFRTEAGAVGSAVISQVSAGHKNRLHFEVAGAGAALGFDQEAPDHLRLSDRDATHLLTRDPDRLTPAAARYSRLPPGHPQGYEDCLVAFVGDTYAAVRGAAVDGLPDFEHAARAVRLTEAVLASAAGGGAWVDVARTPQAA
jgi:predicted dehydrogenase